MKKIVLLIAALIILLLPAAAMAAKIEFNYDSGIYMGSISVEITGGENIYYTTDGSLPTQSSNKYTGPIPVSAQSSTFPENSFWWDERVTVPMGTVLRAAVIENGEVGEVVSRTYFVGSSVVQPLGNIPLMNLIVTPYDLWDSQNGIYSNYNYEHKVAAELQCIDTSGKAAFELSGIETKVSGHGSRSAAKKSLRIYTKKKNPLVYDLIPDASKNYLDKTKITTFSKFTFRISDWSNTNLRDVVAQKLAVNTRVDTAQSTPVALFLNGKYWGLYECREQYDNKYIASHYDVDKDDVVFFDRDWTLAPQYDVLSDTGTTYIDKLEYSEGPEDGGDVLGESYYRNQWRYVQSLAIEQDITDEKVYAEFCANVDIDNFIDYLIVYIYSANDDWPGNNFKFWRVTEEKIDPSVYGADGRWRFMVHDFDIAFENINHNTLELSALYKGDVSDARHPEFATKLLGSLLKNESFRNELAQRTMAYASTYMSREGFKSVVDKLLAERRDGKYADLMRWNLGASGKRLSWWEGKVNEFITFANGRGEAIQWQYTSILNNTYGAGISGTADISVSSPQSYEVNGAMLDNGENALKLFSGIPVSVKAKGANITVSDGSVSQTYVEAASFTPENGKNYSVSIEHIPAFIKAEGNAVSFVSDSEARAIIAGYNSDGSLAWVNTAVFSGEYISGAEGLSEYGVKAMLWKENCEPACESLILSRKPIQISIARPAGFTKMSVGEKLPVIVFDQNGNRLDCKITAEGDCIRCENGMLTALAPGSGTLTAIADGEKIMVDAVVK